MSTEYVNRRTGLYLAVMFAAGCASSSLPRPADRAQSSGTAHSDVAIEPIGLASERHPMPGVTTGGKPTEDQLRRARQLGYRTIINLLPETESPGEAALAATLGFRFVSIPVAGANELNEATAQRLAVAMDAADAKPLILHCGSGNRAGGLLALRAFYVDGASREEALALGDRAGLTSLRPRVEQLLAAACENGSVRSDACD